MQHFSYIEAVSRSEFYFSHLTTC